jgi:aldose 1-epimerase
MGVKYELFGTTPEGEKVGKFILNNSKGITATIMSLGGTVISLKMPDREGKIKEITLGFDNLQQYLAGHSYFGAAIGRFANRIAKGVFQLDGVQYYLARNDHDLNHLHGGNKGFDKVVWQAESFKDTALTGVVFSYLSSDGEEGYPGNLKVTITYSLNENNEFKIEYDAQTDKTTIVNLTNHTYWNLAGAGSGTIMNHQLTLKSKKYLPVNNHLIPTGEIKTVYDTPMDFTKPKLIGKDVHNSSGGYDHCFVIEPSNQEPSLAARLYEPESGRTMEILTTTPGIQFYSGNFLDSIRGAGGALFQKHSGLCLETGFFPNSINEPGFPSPILYPDRTYHQITIHRFSTENRL